MVSSINAKYSPYHFLFFKYQSSDSTIKQKRRKLGPERLTIVRQETSKHLKADFILEMHYLEWLSNMVMVKKASEKWRMCVDFTDLNKTCPKGSCSLSSIDRLVDASTGHHVLSFMDAFLGYNQIMMDPSDQESTTFIIEKRFILLQGHAI